MRKIFVLAIVMTFVLVGTLFADVNDGLQAWYAFSGNTNDGSGHGYDGTAHGATLTNDRFGNSNKAYYFNGLNAYIGLGNPEGLNFTGAITIAAWIRPDVIKGVDINRNIVAHGYGGSPVSEDYLRIANDGQYEAGVYVQGAVSVRATYIAPLADQGSWVHLAGLYDGSAWRLYRNGTEVASTPATTGAVYVDENWAIGAEGYGYDRFFTGAIDDVRIYNRALNASEVQELYEIPEPATLLLFLLGVPVLRRK